VNRIYPFVLTACLAAGTPPLAMAQATDWTVDPAKSRLGFSGTQTGARFEGVFRHFDAQIRFDPAHPQAGHARVVFDMASASTGDTQRDEAMPNADWFDVRAFPKAVFEARSFESRGGNTYAAVGTLTIRGISRDVMLPFTLAVDGDTAHAKGRLDLIRTQFGVGQGPWASGQWVAVEVGVDIDLTATRAKP